MADLILHTLGCGSAKPSATHNPSSSVLSVGGSLLMFDCGEGAQAQMRRMRLNFARLGHIFLTHLHGDHVFGLPGLVGTLALQQRVSPLTIHTFDEGERVLRPFLDYFNRGLPFEVQFNIIRPEEAVIYEDKHITVRTIPLRHRVKAVGYVVEEKPGLRHIDRAMCDYHGVPVAWMRRLKEGEEFVKPDGTVIPSEMLTRPATPPRRYAHISDTAYFPELAPKIGPVDLLFHETTYMESECSLASDRGHSTAHEAATVARDAGAKMLLTGHYSSRYSGREKELVAEAREIFPDSLLNFEGLKLRIGAGPLTTRS